MRKFLLLLLVMLAASTYTAARVEFLPKPPRIITDDTALHLQVRVEPNSANRVLRVFATDEDGGNPRSSDEQLEGADARAIYVFEWDSLPAGTVAITAVILDGGGKPLAADVEPVQVIEMGL